jgi:hypothetical protein
VLSVVSDPTQEPTVEFVSDTTEEPTVEVVPDTTEELLTDKVAPGPTKELLTAIEEVPDTTAKPDSSSNDESSIKSVRSMPSYPCCCECTGQPCDCSCTESMKVRGGYIKIDDIMGESERLKTEEESKRLGKKEATKAERYRTKQETNAKCGRGSSRGGYHKGSSHSRRNLCDGDNCDEDISSILNVTTVADVGEGFTEEANVGVDDSEGEDETTEGEDDTEDETTEGKYDSEDETTEGKDYGEDTTTEDKDAAEDVTTKGKDAAEEATEDDATGMTLLPAPRGGDGKSRESAPSVEMLKPEPFLLCCCECDEFPCDCEFASS